MTTLIIDHDYSFCGHCNVSVNPYDKYHTTTYTSSGPIPGCGREYTALGTRVWRMTPSFIASVRVFHPSLPFVGRVPERTIVQ